MSAGSYERFVGLRYVRPRTRTGFVSFISATSMLGIAIAVAVLIIVLSVMNGFETELRERILGLASHATISGIDGPLPHWQDLRDYALQHPDVIAGAPYVEGEGMLVNGERLSGVLVRGIDPQQERTVAALDDIVRAGSSTGLEGGKYRMAIGAALAEELGVTVGDSAILVISKAIVTPAGIMPRLRRFQVAAIFEAGMYEFDRGLVFVELGDAQRLFRLGDAVTGVRLRLEDMFRAREVVREVARGMGIGVYVSDWTSNHANFFRSIQLTKTFMFLMLLFVFVVAAINIISTLVLVVKDKRADIAIMRTMGATPRSVMKVFMTQGTLIGAIGTLGGVALGIVGALNIEAVVRALERLLRVDLVSAEVYYLSDLPAELRPAEIAGVAAIAFAVALASTVLPAWFGSRTPPAQALRHE